MDSKSAMKVEDSKIGSTHSHESILYFYSIKYFKKLFVLEVYYLTNDI